MIDMHGPVPRQHLGLIGLMLAFHHFHLFGAPLFRGFAKLGGDGIRVYQFLGKARFGKYDRRSKNQIPERTHGKPLQDRPEGVTGW
jgi:hypothetical protein